jgi:hypothetical protein
MGKLGEAIDKLYTHNLKLFNNVDEWYKIKNMSKEEFYAKYNGEAGLEELRLFMIKSLDLNILRNSSMNEVDQVVLEMIAHYTGRSFHELDDGKFLKRAHKTANLSEEFKDE